MTVVLDVPIGAVTADAAGPKTVGALVGHIPANELPDLLDASHTQERCAHDRPVANPGARVAPWPRLQGGCGARHEHVRGRRERGTNGIRGPVVAGPLFLRELCAPIKCRLADHASRGLAQALYDALIARA